MPVSADTLRLLMDAGLSGDELLRVVASIDADTQPKPRSSAAERQARYRQRQKAESVTSDVTSDASQSVTEVTPLARVEDNLQTKNSTEERKQDTRRNGLADFKAVLRSHLGDVRLEAFVAVRRAKRAAFTGHAADLFLADAAAVSMSPADAADLCISQCWITVKPHYLANRARTSTGPPKTQSDALRELGREAGIIDDTGNPTGRLETSLRDRDDPGVGHPLRLAFTGH